MMRSAAFVMLSLTGLLAACGESPQNLTQSKKPDATAYSGAAKVYMVSGWTAGDKTSWEQQLRARGQKQNDYSR
ncbi:hypothetical protein [Roseateles toxinivorans]|uniref:Lipoprotein n=1 Tax=Roseateles toxinivorans TaxID=270368 RepID=A0A4R6QNU8_9BURK|nr:hypothetical protein [Roseateles toxinivorans]TDP71685.1 hypothetical protein DES47_103667 [Roseateles toxinivorans]